MITVEKLTKSFGLKPAVDHLSFQVDRGEILGFLGPNGAGKSTSMRMITGFLTPTDGKVSVCGFDVLEQSLEARRRIGYLPENAPIYSDMSVRSFLGFCAEIRGLFGAAKDQAIERVVDLCFLGPVFRQSVDTLSKGYRHRTCLAQALIHDPEVLILDEPTDGLDPNQKHEVRSLIKRMGPEKAIVFSTHILEEVDAVCTRALIIDRGRIVANGTPAELRAGAPQAGSILLTVRALTWGELEPQLLKLPHLAKAESYASEDRHRTVVRLHPKGELLPELLEAAARGSWKVEHLNVDEGRLDEVFRAITHPDTKQVA
jgi:ABC-2 type transport system ATP-binding protein